MGRGTFALALVIALLAVAAPARAGTFTSFDLPSPLVDTTTAGGDLAKGTVTTVRVLLPDGYDAKRKRGYPVLWLLHGANGGNATWEPGIATLLEDFPGIVVMPEGGRFGMYMNWFNEGRRGGPAWTTWHLENVRRAVHRRYRIRPGRRWHAVGGISMGGQGTLRYAAMLPGYFGSAAAFSAAVPDMQAPEAELGLGLLAQAGNAPGATYAAIFGPARGAYAEGNSPQALAPNYGHTRLYVTSGDGTPCPGDPGTATFALDVVTETVLHSQQARFAAAARAVGAQVEEHTTCGVHTFGVWDRAIPHAYRNWGFFAPVPDRPASWTYRTIATRGEMWGLRFRFAEPPGAVATFTRARRSLTAAGTGTVAITAPKRCRTTLTLPAEHRLPKACTRRLASG